MTVTSTWTSGSSVDLTQAAQRLVTGLLAEPWGQVSPSVYETGRLITLAPWLVWHTQRVEYLLAAQRPDGRWGAPEDGYALVPTLSATEALLATLRRSGPRDPMMAAAAQRGLRILTGWLAGRDGPWLPDMPAIELIAPSLIILINVHLQADPALGFGPLSIPESMDGEALAAIRAALAAGLEVPEKLLHALEIAGETAYGLAAIGPEVTGTIGAAPAATAAWLAGPVPPEPGHPARQYLEAAAGRHSGPVPCGLPITVFERAWVLSILTRAGIPITVPEQLIRSLKAGLGRSGTPAAAGLPADADTTAGALYALALLGVPHPPDALWEYETETHFCTWAGEQGRSISTNAHVLEAFGQYVAELPETADRYRPTVGKLVTWLSGQQREDGSWLDRWHASPYYATACAALALHQFGGAGAVAAVRRAVEFLLATQRPDGSWGLWEGSPEETAYALQVLRLTGPGEHLEDAARARAFLLSAGDGTDGPPMWHDKDLYLPTAIVQATVLAALRLVLVE
jgi:halimadienyl-diphosphate synthase